jgi:CRISPR-associated protein Cas1
MLGPGVSITHAAVSVLADHGCLITWTGEGGIRFYAAGMGETRSASNFLHQAKMWADPESRIEVVRNLYQIRFAEKLDSSLSIKQIRGMEGVRVRDAYAKASRETGVEWKGRNYQRNEWSCADPVNRALSTANSCLYGICHTAIVSAGFSSALGFIHTGKMLSFVYDIADLYKTEITIPASFKTVAEEEITDLERRVRLSCRDRFVETRLLARIIPDIQKALGLNNLTITENKDPDWEMALPGSLWDPENGKVEGGKVYLPGKEEGE